MKNHGQKGHLKCKFYTKIDPNSHTILFFLSSIWYFIIKCEPEREKMSAYVCITCVSVCARALFHLNWWQKLRCSNVWDARSIGQPTYTFAHVGSIRSVMVLVFLGVSFFLFFISIESLQILLYLRKPKLWVEKTKFQFVLQNRRRLEDRHKQTLTHLQNKRTHRHTLTSRGLGLGEV